MRRPQRQRRPRHLAGHHARITSPASSGTQSETVPLKVEPRWWVRDILVAGIVGLIVGALNAYGTISAQRDVDDARADRALRAANLAFVRDRSSSDPDLPRPFPGIDLREQDLGSLELNNANFFSSSLFRARLRSTKLVGANLLDADLTDADMANVTLSDADVRYAVLRGAKLLDAKLINTELISSDLTGADLFNADLIDADLRGAVLKGTNLMKADFTGADLLDADLTGACWEPPGETGLLRQALSAKWPQGFTPPPSDPTNCALELWEWPDPRENKLDHYYFPADYDYPAN